MEKSQEEAKEQKQAKQTGVTKEKKNCKKERCS